MISLQSKITRALLSYYYLNPGANHYTGELQNMLILDKRNLVKKLKEFEKEGLFVSERKGNIRFYSLNKKYPLYNEYKKIILKSVGIEQSLKEISSFFSEIREAYIYGSYAKDKMDTASDIDLLVIGSHSIVELQKRINRLQKESGREINITHMEEKEFQKKKKDKDSFIYQIINSQTVKVK